MRVLAFFVLSFISFSVTAQSKFTLNGYIRDSATGESVIGATISVVGQQQATISNSYGFFSITLDSGVYELSIAHVSYLVQIAQVSGSDSFFSAPVDPDSLTQTLDRLITKRLRLRTQSEPPTAGARSGSGAQAVLDQMTRAENSHRA